MTTATATALAEVYAHGPGKDPRPGPPPARPPRRLGKGVPLAPLAAEGRYAQTVIRLLQLALAPRRWEPWNIYNDHRLYPSPRAAYLVDVAVRGEDGWWELDPVRQCLQPPGAGAPGRSLSGAAPLRLRPTLHPERMPAGYGPLATALAWLEAGHVAGALADTATALGLEVRIAAGPGELPAPPAGSALELDLLTGDQPGQGWERVTAPRSSGIGPRGLSCDPRPLPGAYLPRLAAAATAPPPGSPAAWGGLHHAVAVRGVTDHPDGWYAPRGDQFVLRAPADALAQVQTAFSYPRQDIEVAGMNLAWVITAPTSAAIRATGAAGYHRLLLSAGAVAQHVGAEAATVGMFCRPARSVHEAPLEAAAAVPADHDFLYLLLLGRSRVRDFAYHLIPPEVLS